MGIDIVMTMDKELYTDEFENALGKFACEFELIINVVDKDGKQIMLIGGRL